MKYSTVQWSIGGLFSTVQLGVALCVVAGTVRADAPRQWYGHDTRRLSGGLYAALDGSIIEENASPTRMHTAFAAEQAAGDVAPIAPWISAVHTLGADPAQLPVSNKNQAEPHIIRSRANPLQLLAVFQDARLTNGGASGCGIALSDDGGFTWQRRLHPNLTRLDGSGVYYRATDPVAGADLAGNLFTNHLAAVNSDFSQSHVVICRSSDGGQNWTPPAVIARSTYRSATDNTFPDKNWMAVNDYAGTSTAGRIVCTWTRFRTLQTANYKYDDTAIYLATSDNQGASWTSPMEITEPAPEWSPGEPFLTYTGAYQSSFPLFLPDGKLIVPYWKFADNSTDDAIHFALSNDGGSSFVQGQPQITTIPYPYADPYARSGGFIFGAAVARTAGTVYIAYQAEDNAADYSPRIYVVRSLSQTMSGNNPAWTWSTPVAVDDLAPKQAVFGAAIAASDDGLHVTVLFYDKRNDPSNQYLCDIYLAESFDGGATWQPNRRVTPNTFDMRKATLTGDGYMLGDYFGFAPPATEDPAMVALWIGATSLDSDPRCARIGEWRGSSFARWQDANFSATERANPGKLGPADDYDSDGLSNLAEYALFTDPQLPNGAVVHLNYADPYYSASQWLSYDTPASPGDFAVEWEGSRNGIQWEKLSPERSETLLYSQGRSHRDERCDYAMHRMPLLRLVATQAASLAQPAASVVLAQTPHPLGELYVTDLGNWQWSPWLGFVYLDAFPYVFHPQLGWVYVYGTGTAENFYYDFGLGWCYTSAQLFPDLFVFGDATWVRHYPTAEQPRMFYNYARGVFETR
ncbi:MAG: sialidase family protein [Verrucomicrobiota bacterium]|nr:sialidase family protein [Verrucomicrobiota bacterium]